MEKNKQTNKKGHHFYFRLESNEAQDVANALYDLAAQLEYNATIAENYTTSLETSIESADNELSSLKQMLNETEILFAHKLLEYEAAVEASAEIADEILDEVIALNQTLQNLQGQIADLESNLVNLSIQLSSALNASITARRVADQALLDAENAQVLADEKKEVQEATAMDANVALANYNNQSTYSSLANIIVSSYAICNASRQWEVPGQPYCLGQ